MTLPKNKEDYRPEYTGWFADLAKIENVDKNKVGYPECGLRFAGSTMDFTALYRFISVLELYEKENITVEDIHRHV